MAVMKQESSTVALIGDIVASRGLADRAGVQRELTSALADHRAADAGALALDVTVGDEFQGHFATLGSALDATLKLRLNLRQVADLRFGIGVGQARTLDADRGIVDGPAWWAARAAIEECSRLQEQAATRHLRAVLRVDSPDSAPEPGAGPAQDAPEPGSGLAQDLASSVNAALLCRDHLVGSLDERGVRILERLLSGMSQLDVAEAEGVSASAVSQRVRSNGIGALLASHEALRRVMWPGSPSG